MKTRCFDHIDLRVTNMETAKKFYGKFLPQLGFIHEKSGRYYTFYSGGGDNSLEFFGFTRGQKPSSQRHTHRVLGGHARRSGWIAKLVRDAGGKTLRVPKFAGLQPGYYAFFSKTRWQQTRNLLPREAGICGLTSMRVEPRTRRGRTARRGLHALPSRSRAIELRGDAIENHKMKTRCFDHIDLRVTNMETARKFYGKFLPQLGFVHESRATIIILSMLAAANGRWNFSVYSRTRTIVPTARASRFGQTRGRSGSDCETRARRWREKS